jgi:Sulfotransferase family
MKIVHLRFPPSVPGAQVLQRVHDSGTSVSMIPLRQGGSRWDASLLVSDQLSQYLLDDLLSISPNIRVSLFDIPPAPERMFERPVIILGAPRSGTTMLFETLSKCANVWTIGGESLDVFDRWNQVEDRGNRLDYSDADPDAFKRVIGGFLSVVRDRQGRLYLERDYPERPGSIRFLEKTPRNSLRIPFLRSMFPDSRFIFLYREPRSNIGSLIDGWQHARGRWTFLYPPGWRELIGKPTPDIAAAQWRAANHFILMDLMDIPRDHWMFIEYEKLVADSEKQIRKLCQFTSLEMDDVLETLLKGPLPLSQTTLTPPHPEKWRRHEKELDRVMPSLEAITAKVEQLQRFEGSSTAR